MERLGQWLRSRKLIPGRKRPSLEVHIAISPTRVMFNMVHAFTISLRRFGGAYKDAPVIVTVGEEEYAPELTDGSIGWLARNNVSLRLVPPYLYRKRTYFATGTYRMLHDFQADVVLLVDSDVLVAQPFDELVASIAATGEFAALIEFGSPFFYENSPTWQQMYEHCGLGEPQMIHEYTGWGVMEQDLALRYCPPWFNLAVVFAPRRQMTRIGQRIYPLLDCVEEIEPTLYRSQIAVSLAVVEAQIPYRALPIRYHFPFHPGVEKRYESEVSQASFLHYSRLTEAFNKWQVFQDLDSIEAMIRRTDFTGILARVRDVLEEIYPTMVEEQEGLGDGPFRLGRQWVKL